MPTSQEGVRAQDFGQSTSVPEPHEDIAVDVRFSYSSQLISLFAGTLAYALFFE